MTKINLKQFTNTELIKNIPVLYNNLGVDEDAIIDELNNRSFRDVDPYLILESAKDVAPIEQDIEGLLYDYINEIFWHNEDKFINKAYDIIVNPDDFTEPLLLQLTYLNGGNVYICIGDKIVRTVRRGLPLLDYINTQQYLGKILNSEDKFYTSETDYKHLVLFSTDTSFLDMSKLSLKYKQICRIGKYDKDYNLEDIINKLTKYFIDE